MGPRGRAHDARSAVDRGALDHEEARVRMKRLQALVALLVLVLLVGGAAYADREFEPSAGTGRTARRAPGPGSARRAGVPRGGRSSCRSPNPGDRPATLHVRSLGSGRPSRRRRSRWSRGRSCRSPSRDAAGVEPTWSSGSGNGWASGGSRTPGRRGGRRGRPCAPAAGERWLLPDGTTKTEGDRRLRRRHEPVRSRGGVLGSRCCRSAASRSSRARSPTWSFAPSAASCSS